MLKLLTQGNAIAKLQKDSGKGYLPAVMYLASGQYDARLCPAAGACKNAKLGLCLVLNSGRTAMSKKQSYGPYQAKINRTKWFYSDQSGFMSQLRKEITAHEKRAKKLGLIPAIRLNGGSDLDWTSLYQEFPNIQFWEYTKRPDLALRLQLLSNVNVTYSYSENTTPKLFELIAKNKVNISVVFAAKKNGKIPKTFLGKKVIDGDKSDLRFLDKKGLIVGLRFKSASNKANKMAMGLKSGFIQPA